MDTASTIKHVLHLPATGVIQRELLTTDRIMQRYAVGEGSGLPTETWDDNPRISRPSPLDDHSHLVVHDIVRALPPKTNRLVRGWYFSPVPTSVLAQQLGMSSAGLKRGINVALNFLKWKFEGSSSITLKKILVLRIP